ncbi:hypothetical protein PFICI_07392 [Pestalotiopsis fici W106-1]|uniref:Uncharacterized protein n=1 Tax=Pestalotiopsis fici (strain W106-1 / CGMCC3.15140) TaxID=1229662 RepID=W3X159_PESFW|nr:uncharacterized protein PFICI_07392 [Pestalotiopsis fici W106-1]ETS79863.1 hypothetical protein PFICI_07392 [Pestalotiopsis fici W106-1]
MSQNLQTIAQEALDTMQIKAEENTTMRGEDKLNSFSSGNEFGTSYEHSTGDDKSSQAPLEEHHTESGRMTPCPIDAGTPPTQMEASEPSTPAHGAEVPEVLDQKDGASSLDFTAPTVSPISAAHDETLDALFEIDEDYENQHEKQSANPSNAISLPTGPINTPILQLSTIRDSSVDAGIDGGTSDGNRGPRSTSPTTSIASSEDITVETQLRSGSISEKVATQDLDLGSPQEDTNSNSITLSEPAVSNTENSKGSGVEYVDHENDQTVKEEHETTELPEFGEIQNTTRYDELETRVPVAFMEVSPRDYIQPSDQDSHKDHDILVSPDADLAQQVVHDSAVDNPKSNSMTDTEINDRKDTQLPDTDVNGDSEPQLTPPKLEPDANVGQESAEEPREYQETLSRKVLDKEEIQKPEENPEPDEGGLQPTEQPDLEIEATKPKVRKPLPTAPVKSNAPKKAPTPKGPRKRKLGIYEYSWESDPESYPKKSKIACPQPDAKGKKPPATARTGTKKRQREASEAEGAASDDEALAGKKAASNKKPRVPKVKEIKADKKSAPEKKTPQKRGPKPGSKKTKKVEEVKPVVDTDFENDSEFVVEGDEEGDSEDD